ncbi:MAG: glutamine--fructose-6-phosphate transaminase (isomerizing) [Spirochaetaceae bacterium]|nr:glutamine--fructose-6-phosphate transaminase (isomerizing) [Spirochaetaceae bacterium]
MCGIVGYCGNKPASGILLEGLRRLEYRGYDSAGICVGTDTGLKVIKKTGKIRDLKAIVPEESFGHNGIGHTRWATHGGVTDENAHPHTDCSGKISVVHNGIIENYNQLKDKLLAKGHVFKSETDTEVIAHLVEDIYTGNLTQAVRETVKHLKGTYGIVVMHYDNPNLLVGARNGSPLILGVSDNEMFVASDVNAMISYTKQVVYLEDGEIISITPDGFEISDFHEKNISRPINEVDWEFESFEKGNFEHFMLKEIFEQKESVMRGMAGRLNINLATGHLGGLNMTNSELLNIERVIIVAAGTSFHAGLVASYLLESLARIPASAELASELRYRNPIIQKNALYFVVSQSGETADTLFALRELKRKGAKVLGICNVVGSTIARETDGGVYIHSGPEIAVASTKAFTSQLVALYIFTLLMARMKDMSFEAGSEFAKQMFSLPDIMDKALSKADEIKKLAKKYNFARSFLFLGRGINYPVAMEGALKLKEISYIHAEGFSAAEIKHGPIALINEVTPSLFLVPDDRLREKVISNMKEVKARKGKVIAIAVEGDKEVAQIADDIITVPHVSEFIYPFVMIIPLQLFAYYMAIELGRDVDQPRNLAKSVTVE